MSTKESKLATYLKEYEEMLRYFHSLTEEEKEKFLKLNPGFEEDVKIFEDKLKENRRLKEENAQLKEEIKHRNQSKH